MTLLSLTCHNRCCSGRGCAAGPAQGPRCQQLQSPVVNPYCSCKLTRALLTAKVRPVGSGHWQRYDAGSGCLADAAYAEDCAGGEPGEARACFRSASLSNPTNQHTQTFKDALRSLRVVRPAEARAYFRSASLSNPTDQHTQRLKMRCGRRARRGACPRPAAGPAVRSLLAHPLQVRPQ